jgi:hypothetical protein
VEIRFNRITQQAVRRGTFRSLKELVDKIDQGVENSNNHAQSFVSTAMQIRSSLRSNDYVFPGRYA